MNERPQRVVVTSPRTGATRARRPYPATREIDEQTELGEVYMRSLIRTQLRLGLLVCLLACGALLALPAVFFLLPAVREMELFGIGLPWLLLGAVAFPGLLASGWFYVRQAERSEREFAELVERA